MNLTDTLLERDLVAELLEKPHNVKEVSKLIKSDVFTDDLFEASYLACVELSETIGMFTRSDVFRLVKTKNKDLDASKILTLRPERAISDYTEICMELSDLLTKRKIDELSNSLKTMLVEGVDIDTLQVALSSSQEDIKEVSNTTAVINISDLLEETLVTLESNAGKTKISGVDTGSRSLNYTLGGWQTGMHVIAARPSAGKTIVGLDFLKKASMSGVSTLFVSLEMPSSQLMYRLISSEAPEFSYSDLGSYRINVEQVAKIRRSEVNKLRSLPIHFYDGDNRDINYLSNVITAQVRRHKIKMVVIDYLQLMRDTLIKDMSDFAQVSSISNKIQRLARKLDIPIIVLSQLSRAVETRNDKRPQLSDIRSSGNVEQDASIVIGLYRPHYYAVQEAKANGLKEPETMDTTIEFVILKNRNGRTGTVYRHCDVLTNRVEDNAEDLMTFEEKFPVLTNDALNSVKSDFFDATADENINPF